MLMIAETKQSVFNQFNRSILSRLYLFVCGVRRIYSYFKLITIVLGIEMQKAVYFVGYLEESRVKTPKSWWETN